MNTTKILIELSTNGLPHIDEVCTVIENRVCDYLVNKGVDVKLCKATLQPSDTPEFIGLVVRNEPPVQPVEGEE